MTSPANRRGTRPAGAIAVCCVASVVLWASQIGTAAAGGHAVRNDDGRQHSVTEPVCCDEFDSWNRPARDERGELPNLGAVMEPVPIVWGSEDAAIREAAEARGYRLQRRADNLGRLVMEDGVLLQPLAAEAWGALKSEAARSGHLISAVSGYRGTSKQRAIFLRGLSRPVTPSSVERRLRTVAPPGYSKHHSGYAVDIASDRSGAFVKDAAFEWLEANDYQMARLHGWEPSYPEGGGRQGPDPEFWEYVYVGPAVAMF